jgi:RimJ/RimL family protein N-acetyltransferase
MNMDVPFIEGKGMYLREIRVSDLDGGWYSWFNDSEVTRLQNKKIFPNSRERQRDYYESLKRSDTDVVLAIIDAETVSHIGNVGLHHIDWIHRSAELGIVIGNKKYWGRGFGAQAWKMISVYGFDTLNLHRIYAIVMVDNTPSCRCAEAAGFEKEGEIRDYLFKNGTYYDAFYYNAINPKVENLKRRSNAQ